MTLPKSRKSESHLQRLGGQIKLVNFVPKSIVPNIECFLDIKEGPYYMCAPVEAFRNGLGETKKVVVC